jgi:hypothetical protein
MDLAMRKIGFDNVILGIRFWELAFGSNFGEHWVVREE